MRARRIARSAAILVGLPVLVGIALAEGYVRWADGVAERLKAVLQQHLR